MREVVFLFEKNWEIKFQVRNAIFFSMFFLCSRHARTENHTTVKPVRKKSLDFYQNQSTNNVRKDLGNLPPFLSCVYLSKMREIEN